MKLGLVQRKHVSDCGVNSGNHSAINSNCIFHLFLQHIYSIICCITLLAWLLCFFHFSQSPFIRIMSLRWWIDRDHQPSNAQLPPSLLLLLLLFSAPVPAVHRLCILLPWGITRCSLRQWYTKWRSYYHYFWTHTRPQTLKILWHNCITGFMSLPFICGLWGFCKFIAHHRSLHLHDILVHMSISFIFFLPFCSPLPSPEEEEKEWWRHQLVRLGGELVSNLGYKQALGQLYLSGLSPSVVMEAWPILSVFFFLSSSFLQQMF